MKHLVIILCALFLLFPTTTFARGGGGGHSTGGHSGGGRSTGGSSTGGRTGGNHSGSIHNSSPSTGTHPKTFCKDCPRDNQGRIERSSSEREKFLKSKGLTHTPKGDQVDHIVPLSKGGKDKASNMQLIRKVSPKEKNELK